VYAVTASVSALTHRVDWQSHDERDGPISSKITHKAMISYDHIMTKRAISLTLDSDNVTWLKGRAGAAGLRSVSQLVDNLVTDARRAGRGGPSRSVVGTIDIDPADPFLEGADAAVRAVYERSLGRPLVVKEGSSRYATRRRIRKPRG
jgi:hypothetical protein